MQAVKVVYICKTGFKKKIDKEEVLEGVEGCVLNCVGGCKSHGVGENDRSKVKMGK